MTPIQLISIFANMGRKTHIFLAIMLLGFFVPAILGFALIHHSCAGCDCQEKETAFIIIPQNHHHNQQQCNSCSIDKSAKTCSENTNSGSCSCMDIKEEHQHMCQVDIKKIDEPFTASYLGKVLPEPVEIELSSILENFIYLISNVVSIIGNNIHAAPTDYLTSGIRLLLSICVLRL